MSMCSFFMLYTLLVVVSARSYTVIDEDWVCSVKKTCFDCLKLPQCSWCSAENKCFSQKLVTFRDFCPNNTINHDEDYGLSLEENADCLCADGKKHLRCYPPGTTEGLECSGKGICKCGHCICDPNPYPLEPTKAIMGEYCEYDNFSCDGPKCNEGPYSISGISQPMTVEDAEGKVKNDVEDGGL